MQKYAESSLEMTKVREHLANERTFLAWNRTSLGIMAFGFVVEKFSLFIRKMTMLLHDPKLMQSHAFNGGLSSFFGIILIALGAIICALAFLKFKLVEKQIIDNCYKPSSTLNIILTLLIIFTGVLMAFYLLASL